MEIEKHPAFQKENLTVKNEEELAKAKENAGVNSPEKNLKDRLTFGFVSEDKTLVSKTLKELKEIAGYEKAAEYLFNLKSTPKQVLQRQLAENPTYRTEDLKINDQKELDEAKRMAGTAQSSSEVSDNAIAFGKIKEDKTLVQNALKKLLQEDETDKLVDFLFEAPNESLPADEAYTLENPGIPKDYPKEIVDEIETIAEAQSSKDSAKVNWTRTFLVNRTKRYLSESVAETDTFLTIQKAFEKAKADLYKDKKVTLPVDLKDDKLNREIIQSGLKG